MLLNVNCRKFVFMDLFRADLSLTCRENQLREALAKSLELNVNNSLYNNNYQPDELSKLEPYELSSEFVKDATIPSAILDYSPDEGLFDYEGEENFSDFFQ